MIFGSNQKLLMARAGAKPPVDPWADWANPNLATASYDSVSFSVAAQDTAPQGVAFKLDGTKMYMTGENSDAVNEYTLSTAWDISTSSFVQNFSVAGQESTPTDLYIRSDGKKMYLIGSSSDRVQEYTLSTAWDISTSSFVQNFSVAGQESIPGGLFFKIDGTKMYVIGRNSDAIHEYTLSTAWSVSSATFTQSFSVAPQESSPEGLFFSPDGTNVFVIGFSGDAVNEYTLSTAWDISTSSFVQNFSVAGQDASPRGLFFKVDGSKMYVVGSTNDAIYQYSTA